MGRVSVTEIRDRSIWNDFVLGLPYYDLEQGYEWGEVLREADWTPYRYAVLDGNTCIAAIAIMARQLPGLGCSLLSASRGPIVDWKDQVAWSALMQATRDAAAATRAIFLRVSPGVLREEIDLHEALVQRGFIQLPDDWTTWNAPRILMTAPLDGNEQELRQRLRKRFREYISSAPRRGLSVRLASSERDVCAFQASLVMMGKEKGYPVREVNYFEALWQNYLSSGQGALLLAEREGAFVAGLLGVRFGRKAYMLHTSVSGCGDSGRLHQGPLLYWEFIRWAKEAGCETINFGGSGTNFPPLKEDPGYGIYHFKLGFGSSLEYMIGYYDLVFKPRLYRAFRFAEQRMLPWVWSLRARFNK